MAEKIGLEGGKQLEAVLKLMPGRIAGRQADIALRAGANVIKRSIQAEAPVSTEEDRTAASRAIGHLKDNIKVTKRRITRNSAEMAVHTGKAFWGLFVEFGTAPHDVKGVAHPGIAPDPFFTRGLEKAKAPALEKVQLHLAKRIEKVAKELAGPRAALSKTTRRRLG